jgi:hypothetical protein
MNILDARDKKGGALASAKVKAPVRVVHLELQTGEAGGGSTTILGLAIPHGIAKKVIADLEASISRMFPKQELAPGDIEMEIVSDDDYFDDNNDDDILVKLSAKKPAALEVNDVDAVHDVIVVASSDDEGDDDDVVSSHQRKTSQVITGSSKPAILGTLVHEKPVIRDKKLYEILVEGRKGKNNGLTDQALFDTLVHFSEGKKSPENCPDQQLKDDYFKIKDAGGDAPVIKTVYYLGETKLVTAGKGDAIFDSYLELSWDGTGKWRKYAKKPSVTH